MNTAVLFGTGWQYADMLVPATTGVDSIQQLLSVTCKSRCYQPSCYLNGVAFANFQFGSGSSAWLLRDAYSTCFSRFVAEFQFKTHFLKWPQRCGNLYQRCDCNLKNTVLPNTAEFNGLSLDGSAPGLYNLLSFCRSSSTILLLLLQ